MWDFSFNDATYQCDMEDFDQSIFDESNLSSELLSEGSDTITQVRKSIASDNMDKSIKWLNKNKLASKALSRTHEKELSELDKKCSGDRKATLNSTSTEDAPSPTNSLTSTKSDYVSNRALKAQISSLLKELSHERCQKEEKLLSKSKF